MAKRPEQTFTVEDHPDLFSPDEIAAGATFITVGGDKATVEAWKARKLGRIERDRQAAEQEG